MHASMHWKNNMPQFSDCTNIWVGIGKITIESDVALRAQGCKASGMMIFYNEI